MTRCRSLELTALWHAATSNYYRRIDRDFIANKTTLRLPYFLSGGSGVGSLKSLSRVGVARSDTAAHVRLTASLR